MSRYLSAGNGRSDFHILLFNEHSTSLSNGALMGSHVTHHLHWSFGRQYQSHITHHHLHVLASSQARSGVKRSVWCAFVPGLCVSFCNDIIISSSSPVIEDTEGLLTEKRTERHLLMPSVWKCWISAYYPEWWCPTWTFNSLPNIEHLWLFFTWNISVFVPLGLLFSLVWRGLGSVRKRWCDILLCTSQT